MSFESALTAGPGAHGLHAVLIIDGIPVAFSTVAGLTFDRDGAGWLGALPASLTTVEAIVVGGAQVEGSRLNHSMLVVEGGGFSCALKSDIRWDKYFDKRRSPKTRLNEDLDPTETSIDVQSSSGWAANDVAYIDREAILIGAVGTNQFTGCSRVYAALPGQMLHAHGAGAVVGSAPRAHSKRLAELWLYLAGNWRVDRRLLLENPTWDGLTKSWRISCKDAIHLLDRQIAVGLDNLPVTSVTLAESADATPLPMIGLELGADFDTLPAATVDGLHAVVTVDTNGETSTSVEEVLEIDDIGGVIYIGGGVLAETWAAIQSAPMRTGSLVGEVVIPPDTSITVRLLMRLNGAPSLEALRVLLSTTGRGDNLAYDDLWGTGTSGSSAVVTAGDYERRFGAAISQDLIDVDSFEALADVGGEGFCYWLGASGQENLRDVLEDIARQCGAYLAMVDGLITLVPLSGIGEYTTVAAELSDEDGTIATSSSMDAVDDESQALHTLEIKCNVDPSTGDTLGTITIRDQRTYETWRDAAPAEQVTMRGLNVSRPERGRAPVNYSILPADLSALVARANKVLHRRQNGLRTYKLTTPFRQVLRKPGDVVRVTCAALRAFDGGSLDSQALEVTSTSGYSLADPSSVTFEVSDTWLSKSIAPTAKITAWNAGTKTATLATSHRYGGSTTPGRQFAAGWKCRILDASATPPFSTASAVLTVSSVTDAEVTFGTAPAFTPVSGDLLVMANYDDADNTTDNTRNLAQRDHAFAADTNGRLGTGDANADEWG